MSRNKKSLLDAKKYQPFRKKGAPVYLFSDRYVASLRSLVSTIPVSATPSKKLAAHKQQYHILELKRFKHKKFHCLQRKMYCNFYQKILN